MASAPSLPRERIHSSRRPSPLQGDTHAPWPASSITRALAGRLPMHLIGNPPPRASAGMPYPSGPRPRRALELPTFSRLPPPAPPARHPCPSAGIPHPPRLRRQATHAPHRHPHPAAPSCSAPARGGSVRGYRSKSYPGGAGGKAVSSGVSARFQVGQAQTRFFRLSRAVDRVISPREADGRRALLFSRPDLASPASHPRLRQDTHTLPAPPPRPRLRCSARPPGQGSARRISRQRYRLFPPSY